MLVINSTAFDSDIAANMSAESKFLVLLELTPCVVNLLPLFRFPFGFSSEASNPSAFGNCFHGQRPLYVTQLLLRIVL